MVLPGRKQKRLWTDSRGPRQEDAVSAKRPPQKEVFVDFVTLNRAYRMYLLKQLDVWCPR